MTAILLIFGSCQYKIYIFSTKEHLRSIIVRSSAPFRLTETRQLRLPYWKLTFKDKLLFNNAAYHNDYSTSQL